MTAAAGFNVDERAREFEASIVTIAGKTFHPKRVTNKLERELRTFGRKQRRITTRIEHVADLGELLERQDAGETIDTEDLARARRLAATDVETVDATEELIEELADQAARVTYEMIAAQLTPTGEDVQVDDIAQLVEDELPIREARAILAYLAGAPDPTPPTTSGDTSA